MIFSTCLNNFYMGDMGSGNRNFKLLWHRHDIWMVVVFCWSEVLLFLADISLCRVDCVFVDSCGRKTMLIPFMWHKTCNILLGPRLICLIYMHIGVGIRTSPFWLKFHTRSERLCWRGWVKVCMELVWIGLQRKGIGCGLSKSIK